MSPSIIDAMEEEASFEDDSSETPPPDIISYNELRSCADLFRMHETRILDIQPDFQRDVVWKGPDQTRFVDSLIKQLPIPSMCFAFDNRAQKWMVIDGLQRMSTIVRLLQGGDWRLSNLRDIEPQIAGKTAHAIKTTPELKQFYTRVENLSIPINVLRCDFGRQSHTDFLFTIFHRLNAGGAKLNNQEIRNCIYGGTFNQFLKELDAHPAWRNINKMTPGENYRFLKQELILRIFAFLDRREQYRGQVASFLNRYMEACRNPPEEFLTERRRKFIQAADLLWASVFRPLESPRVPNTVLEAVFVGAMANLDRLTNAAPAEILARYQSIVADASLTDQSLAEGLAKRDKVQERLDAAILKFAGHRDAA
jgi:hypothetical protein